MPRRAIPLLFTVLFAVSFCFSQRSSGRPGSTGSTSQGNSSSLTRPSTRRIELVVHVVFPNDHPAGDDIAVELNSASGGMVGQGFTNSMGETTFASISPGSYVITVRGIDIKDTSTDIISIEPYDSLHIEYIHVQPLSSERGTEVKSAQGSISAAELNIPGKARKEFEKGNEAAAKGDLNKASASFEKAIELYPKYAMAYNNLGVIYIKSNDKAHAREAWSKALEVDPNLATANSNIARLDVMDDNPAAAIAPLEKALSVEPNSGEVLLLMSEAQLMCGHADQALLFARKVHAADHQKYELAHIIAGRALEAQNHPDLARVEYELLLKEAPTAPEAEEARKSIARLDDVARKQ